MLGDHEGRGDLQEQLFRRIAQFEDAPNDGRYSWLGRPAGLVVGIALLVAALGMGPLVCAMPAETDSALLMKVAGLAWMLVLGFTMVYWRRQRLAAHFESAHRRLSSANPDERQRALVDMMVNARRGRAEHGRIAAATAAYLRQPPRPDPGEPERRQIAFSMLADQTLAMAAKQRLDLSGANLARLRAANAELPGARLRGADLTGALLARANLEAADLSDACLEGTNLTDARLTGALLPPAFKR